MGWIHKKKTVEILYPEITRDDLKDHGIDTPWAAWYTLENGVTPDGVDIREITGGMVPIYNEDIVLTWWYGISSGCHDEANLGDEIIHEMAGDIEYCLWELFMEELRKYAEDYEYVWYGLGDLVDPEEENPELPDTPRRFLRVAIRALLANLKGPVPPFLEDWDDSKIDWQDPADQLAVLDSWIAKSAEYPETDDRFFGWLKVVRENFVMAYLPKEAE